MPALVKTPPAGTEQSQAEARARQEQILALTLAADGFVVGYMRLMAQAGQAAAAGPPAASFGPTASPRPHGA